MITGCRREAADTYDAAGRPVTKTKESTREVTKMQKEEIDHGKSFI